MIERMRVEVGDITRLKVDAIVNAANSTLLGGGGGVYGFPPERAAPIAVAEVAQTLAAQPNLDLVIFCCFSEPSAALHRAALATLGALT